MSGSYKRLLQATLIATVASGTARFIYQVAIGRELGAGTLGNIAIVISLVMTLGGFVSLTVGDAVSKFVSESRGGDSNSRAVRQFSGVVSLFILVLGVAMVLAMVISMLGYQLWNESNYEYSSIFVILLAGSFSLYALMRSGFYGFGLMKQYSLLEITGNVIFVFVTYWILAAVPNLYFIPLLLLYLGFSVVSFGVLYSRGWLRIGWAQIRALRSKDSAVFSFIGVTAIIGVTSVVNGSAPLVIGAFLPAAEVGYYAAANSFLVVVAFIPLVVNRATLPALSYKHGINEKSNLDEFVSNGFRMITESQLFFIASLVILGPYAISIVYDASFHPSLTVLRLLAISSFLGGAASYFYAVLAGTGSIKKCGLAAIASTVLTFTLWLMLIPILQIVGAALGILLGAITRFVLLGYWTASEFSIRVSRTTLALVFVASVSMAIGFVVEQLFAGVFLYVAIVLEIMLALLMIKPTLTALGAFRKSSLNPH